MDVNKDITEKEMQNKIKDELEKCKNNPYYFATKYLTVKYNGGCFPYRTILTEEEFNYNFFNNEK